MSDIIIDKTLCTKCNVCVNVCIMDIIEKATAAQFPSIKKANTIRCFRCGHCESFCPQKALTLDYLVEKKIAITSHDGVIDPHILDLYIKKRRSVRQFSPEPVDRELICRVLEVARYAASGGNSQPVKWMVITDAAIVHQIAGFTIDWFRTIIDTPHPLSNYVPRLITKWEKQIDYICYNAPNLLLTHVPVHGQFIDPTDAVIAMTHVDIAAPSLGLGTCWAGFVKMAANVYQPLQEFLALPQKRSVASAMMLGYPVNTITAIPRRNPVDITWR